MKVYVAAPWKHRPEAAEAGRKLEAAGHIITEKWWEHKDVTINGTIVEDAAELTRQALLDIRAVQRADAFILLNLAYSEGKCVELGLALADEIGIIAVGKPGLNVFHYLPEVHWVETVEDAIVRLDS